MASTYCIAATGQRAGAPDLDESLFAGDNCLDRHACPAAGAGGAVVFDRRVALEASMRAEVMDSHRRTREQLFQAQKMEAVGQPTGGVAHDFNNIPTIVLGNADAIVGDEAAPLIAKRAQQICDAGQRASELTRQLLAFSRKQILKPERSDLSDLGGIDRSVDAAHARRARHRADRGRRATVGPPMSIAPRLKPR